MTRRATSSPWRSPGSSASTPSASIFGAIYEVPAPTIWAGYGVAGVFVLGLILGFAVPGEQTSHTAYDELPDAETGPLKL
jgi:hypothetical protein